MASAAMAISVSAAYQWHHVSAAIMKSGSSIKRIEI